MVALDRDRDAGRAGQRRSGSRVGAARMLLIPSLLLAATFAISFAPSAEARIPALSTPALVSYSSPPVVFCNQDHRWHSDSDACNDLQKAIDRERLARQNTGHCGGPAKCN